MRSVASLRLGARLAFGGFLVLHGLAHGPGVLGSWKLATFQDVSYRPNVWLTDAGDGVVALLGGVWLVAGAAFVLAGIGVVRSAPWWPRAVSGAGLVSLVPCLLWREDAVVGLVIDVVLLAWLGAWTVWQSRRSSRPDREHLPDRRGSRWAEG